MKISQANMAFGADFEPDTGNSGSKRLNCHRLYLGEATQKNDKRALRARLLWLRINIRFLAALRAAYQANGADSGCSEQARSTLRRSSAATLGISLPWVVQAMHLLKVSDLNSQIPLRCFQ